MKHYHELMIALSESVMKKSVRLNIQLAIKPRYFGSHTLQMNRYYGSLPESHDKVHAATGERLTKTSYSVSNKPSLSRKSCIPDKRLQWNATKKSWWLFNNELKHPLLTVAAKSWIKTLKRTIQNKKTHKWPILIIVQSIHYRRVFLKIFKQYVMTIRNEINVNKREAPLGGQITMKSYPACN